MSDIYDFYKDIKSKYVIRTFFRHLLVTLLLVPIIVLYFVFFPIIWVLSPDDVD